MRKRITKILLVDDDPDILEIVSYNLVQEGFEIFTASNGKEAILKAIKDYSQFAGFDAGADDYITKPIKPKLLVSKVKALLRRIKDQDKNSETINIHGIEINREEYKIIKDDVVIALPRKEFELFYLLASKPGKVFKREEILENVWGSDVVVGGRTIDVHIRKLREKIGDRLFKTIKGIGYKFEV